MKYNELNTIRLARRINNSKRGFLLVNPLQAKHMPISPSAALDMMGALAERLKKRYGGRRTAVVGFAETATAISAAVAAALGCPYINTTREHIGDKGFRDFLEEHSHAAQQCIYGDFLLGAVSDGCVVIFVDDELSTGRTLLNIIGAVSGYIGGKAENITMAAASVINRMSAEDMARFEERGIETEYLVRPEPADYEAAVSGYEVAESIPEAAISDGFTEVISVSGLKDPRLGVDAMEYSEACRGLAAEIIGQLSGRLESAADILVLGTEECMYPAIITGRELERLYPDKSVVTHSTTRSPIGIDLGLHEEYPIKSGIRLTSFYDGGRTTHLYNTSRHDWVIAVTDSRSIPQAALGQLRSVFGENIVVFGWTE